MSMATIKLDVEVTPRQVRIGQTISATATVSGAGEPAQHVEMRLSGTRHAMRMNPDGPGRFSYRLRVPSLVPPGTYTIDFRAFGRDGTSAAVPVTITVTR